MSTEPLTLDHLRTIAAYLAKRGLPPDVQRARIAFAKWLEAGEPYRIIRARPQPRRTAKV